MKAPSPICLRVLRQLAFPSTFSARTSSQCLRTYSSLPDRPPPPKPAVTRPPSQPGFKTRQKSDDDADFVPLPLSRPIGLPTPPQPGENTGLDTRSLKQRRDDFVNYDKHLEKRAKMTKQIAKPYFRDWSDMRFHKGKVFVANERLFRGEVALWFPNFFGRTLRKGGSGSGTSGGGAGGGGLGKKDGYGGLGRDTCLVMRGKVSVVSFVSNAWAVNQINTFTQHAPLSEVIQSNKDVAQRVEINYEDNVLKYWILRLFGLRKLRRERTAEEQDRYFIVRRGLSDIVKEAMGLLNDKGGYVYLVDAECRIRWAGSAIAEERERASMVRGLKRLVLEARGERVDEKARLREAVGEVVDEPPGRERKGAVAAG